jgi:hypothetical protein
MPGKKRLNQLAKCIGEQQLRHYPGFRQRR